MAAHHQTAGPHRLLRCAQFQFIKMSREKKGLSRWLQKDAQQLRTDTPVRCVGWREGDGEKRRGGGCRLEVLKVTVGCFGGELVCLSRARCARLDWEEPLRPHVHVTKTPLFTPKEVNYISWPRRFRHHPPSSCQFETFLIAQLFPEHCASSTGECREAS